MTTEVYEKTVSGILAYDYKVEGETIFISQDSYNETIDLTELKAGEVLGIPALGLRIPVLEKVERTAENVLRVVFNVFEEEPKMKAVELPHNEAVDLLLNPMPIKELQEPAAEEYPEGGYDAAMEEYAAGLESYNRALADWKEEKAKYDVKFSELAGEYAKKMAAWKDLDEKARKEHEVAMAEFHEKLTLVKRVK
jgi:hypothetical protein